MILNKEISKMKFIDFAKTLKNIYNKLSYIYYILESKKEKFYVNNKKFKYIIKLKKCLRKLIISKKTL